MRVPFGVTLILSPWNYPFLLTLQPLASALAAGNTAILKPSAYAPASSALLARLIEQTFDSRLAAVVQGGREQNAALLEQAYDMIFFTGGETVGRLVLEKAAQHLTPTVLELGGKSPVYVDKSADLPLAARRIVFGKLLCAGQTCVAPDYVLAHRSIKARLMTLLEREFERQTGGSPFPSGYPRIVNDGTPAAWPGCWRGRGWCTAACGRGCGCLPRWSTSRIPPPPLCRRKSLAPFCRCCPVRESARRSILSRPVRRRSPFTSFPKTAGRSPA